MSPSESSLAQVGTTKGKKGSETEAPVILISWRTERLKKHFIRTTTLWIQFLLLGYFVRSPLALM